VPRKSYTEVVVGRSKCQQYAIVSEVEVNTPSVKSTTEINADATVSTASDQGFVTVVNRNNRHALLNTRSFLCIQPARLCQQTQTLNLLVVVQGQCTMGCAADESGMEGGFSAP
jgi:hypothetical protein